MQKLLQNKNTALVLLLLFISLKGFALSASKTLKYTYSQISTAATANTAFKVFAVKPNDGLTRTNKDSKLRIYLDFGKDYIFGKNSATALITLNITAWKEASGVVTNYSNYTKDGIAGKTVALQLNSSSPELYYELDIDDWFTDASKKDEVNMFYILPLKNVTGKTYLNADSYVQSYLSLTLTHEIEYKLDVSNITTTINKIYTASNPQVFSWSCTHTPLPSSTDHTTMPSPVAVTDVPYWQFQLLRLNNTDEATTNGSDEITSQEINWNNALNLYLESTKQSLTLNIGEGTGYYVWRVRPIGNSEDEGGIANSWNYSESGWSNFSTSSLYLTGATYLGYDYVFWFTDPDKDLNWIYSRAFSEGDATSSIKQYETKTYANGLCMVKQNQALNQTEGFVVTAQTVYDYIGSPALGSMAVPITTKSTFAYVDNFMKNASGSLYRDEDFADDDTYNNPSPVDSSSYFSYYSDNNTDKTIASAQGFPFSAVLYKKDGSGRPEENSMVGKSFKLGSSHTVKTTYTTITDAELIKIFGDEAPNANKVYKVTTTDADGIKTVSLVNFNGQVIANCIESSGALSNYTLFYYDRAGNLVRTVAPKGVVTTSTDRAKNHPSHSYETEYDYNFLGQVVRKKTTDGGEITYYYDSKKRLRFSVNDKQKASTSYSYIKYDALGRIIETGESKENYSTLSNYVDVTTSPTTGSSRTYTVYTTVCPSLSSANTQKYLRNRISYVKNDDGAYIAYSYDAHGNVAKLYTYVPGLDASSTSVHITEYEYDLLSNLVTKEKFNAGQLDQFYHRFTYDANSRLTKVETSIDDKFYETDAAYSFYKHGPLKRTEIGEDHLQGVDYMYTLQGWLKGINHSSLDKTLDPGLDNSSSQIFAPDAFASMLGYYYGDFYRKGSAFNTDKNNKYSMIYDSFSKYNGIITTEVSKAALPTAATGLTYNDAWGYLYRYDKLNRLTSAALYAYNGSAFANSLNYSMDLSYDDNGNITAFKRNGYENAAKTTSLSMDNLTYNYTANTNKLAYVTDAVAATNYTTDIDNQAAGNYTYDAIGNLTKDVGGKISSIEWNVQNKPTKVTKTTKEIIEFKYDPMGNKISKKYTAADGLTVTTTYYALDTKGGIQAIYEETGSGTTKTLKLKEEPIKGNQRIGEYKPSSITIRSAGKTTDNAYLAPTDGFKRKLNQKQYEIVDHLGNIRVTISDVKLSTLDAAKKPGNYTADVTSLNNYYAYGMQMVGNNYSTTTSRFGFNGKEKMNEMEGEGIEYDFGARIYDPRVGRWLSLDPMQAKYVSWSPYNFAIDNPINFVDPDGRDVYHYTQSQGRNPVFHRTLEGVDKAGGSDIYELTIIQDNNTDDNGEPQRTTTITTYTSLEEMESAGTRDAWKHAIWVSFLYSNRVKSEEGYAPTHNIEGPISAVADVIQDTKNSKNNNTPEKQNGLTFPDEIIVLQKPSQEVFDLGVTDIKIKTPSSPKPKPLVGGSLKVYDVYEKPSPMAKYWKGSPTYTLDDYNSGSQNTGGSATDRANKLIEQQWEQKINDALNEE